MTIKLSAAEKQKIIPLVQDYFAKERDGEIGNLAAEFLLDFFIEEIGAIIYNHAIDDVRKYLKLRMEDLEYGLYELEKPISKK